MGNEDNTQDMSEEEQALREEVFAEVFDDDAPDHAAAIVEEIADTDDNSGEAIEPQGEEEPEDEDPMAGIPPALRSTIDGISNRLNSLGVIEERLKQTERRIGSIQNEFHAASQAAAEAEQAAPTKKEMNDAAKNSEDWDDLKDEYPEWADAIEHKLAANSAELSKRLPDYSNLRTELDDIRGRQDGYISPDELQKHLLAFRYPAWEETVCTKGYQAWLKEQPDDVQKKHYSGKTANDAVYVLDRYNEFQSGEKSPQAIAAARKKRLKQAENPKSGGGRQSTPKSEADMSEDEIRELEFGKIWG